MAKRRGRHRNTVFCSFVRNLSFLFSFLNVQTEKALEVLEKFETISKVQLDLTDRYLQVLAIYGRDLESIRKIYQKHKTDPQIPRNLPPIAGKIAWARQLYRKIENPMKVFKNKPEILKVYIYPSDASVNMETYFSFVIYFS